MKVILVRHAESEKNIKKNFSSNQDKEELSYNGLKQAEDLANNIYEYMIKHRYRYPEIFSANTVRAYNTAKEIAKKLNTSIEVVDEFKSLKNGKKLVGLSESEAQKVDAVFMNELALNRAGIFNAYKHTSIFSEEIIKEHEMAVYEKYLEITKRIKTDVIIIVLHHSSLTDIIINLAREYYGYPLNFYGVINADLCHIYLFDHEKGRFELANANSRELLSMSTEGAGEPLGNAIKPDVR